ncbi:carboxylesterase/lipase family protein [Streptomyces sp. NPDC088387]|uniref:carboxylesterase/lipase family protein n=1 Tax=Streptomyces sp. NPDC088387 TaxID=3365859 RepID=UPI00380B668C
MGVLLTATFVATALPAAATATPTAPRSISAYVNSAPVPGSAPTLRTEQGVLRGRDLGASDFFGTVPYAAPPTGPLRWKSPRSAAPWQGVRQATAPSPACAQTANSNGPRSEREDCLYMDVWRPKTAAVRAGRAPVLFWIFGGGGINGAGSQYDAQALAQETGSIVVTVNHRLGWLGFLALPALTREAGVSGQYGFLDQIAGLRWLKRNARALGGDPHRVTVGGQSAGGRAVCRLMASPQAKGLFQQAIIQSGACNAEQLAPRETAGTAFATKLGCADTTDQLACLRRTGVGTMLDRPEPPPGTPTIGGNALPMDPRLAIETGRISRVPVLIGNTSDENRPYPGISQPASPQAYRDWVHRSYPSLANEVLRQYDDMAPPDAAGAVASDPDRVCRAWKIENTLARHTPVYAYEFADTTAPSEVATPGFSWGAYHTTELEYLFSFTRWDGSPKFLTGLNREQQRLAREMRARWGTFLHTGAPRGSRWPGYHEDRQVTMQFQLPGARLDGDFADSHRCRFWDEHGLIRLA